MIIGKGREPTPPGEWEIDRDGRRFRYDGRCIEYEPTITTSFGTLTQRQLHEMNAREKKEEQTFVPARLQPTQSCPFKTGACSNCTEGDCAWYTSEGCAMKCPHPAAGKKCPYTHIKCADDCAMKGDYQ